MQHFSEPPAFIQACSREEAHALDRLVRGPEGQPEQFEDIAKMLRQDAPKVTLTDFKKASHLNGAHGA